MARKKSQLSEIIDGLSEEIDTLQPDALIEAGAVLGREVSKGSLHGIIGSKNNTYIDSVREHFADEKDFYARWLRGLNKKYKVDLLLHTYSRSKYAIDTSPSRMVELQKNDTVRKYTRLFLDRTFYRTLKDRKRFKPADELWSIWFGENKQIWGLLIAPVWRDEAWTNDKSEMRKAPYGYWTVGHVMETGLVDPTSKTPTTFSNTAQLITFYEGVLKRMTSSKYQLGMCDCYLDYLRASADMLSEPFLIPEFRYEGLAVNHKYRLDFTVFNCHTREHRGIELSPASSHMSLVELKAKGLKKGEADDLVKKKWVKEMQKRNDYFDTFEIPIITFTDTKLQDISACFERVCHDLSARPAEPISIEIELDILDNI